MLKTRQHVKNTENTIFTGVGLWLASQSSKYLNHLSLVCLFDLNMYEKFPQGETFYRGVLTY